MTDRHFSDDVLNAYVDGELPPRERARIAASIAKDPKLAGRVALLASLKTAVADSAGAMPEQPAIVMEWPWWRRSPVRYAAVAAAIAIMLTTVWSMHLFSRSQSDNWLQRGLAHHLAWTTEHAADAAKPLDAELLLAAAQQLDRPLHIPNMRSAKLRLTGARFFPADRKNRNPAVQLKFTGRRGCRVSLWIASADHDLPTSLTEHKVGDEWGFYWRIDRTGYAIFASGMNAMRFKLLVRNTYRATHERRRPPTGWRDELRIASNAAPPCSA